MLRSIALRAACVLSLIALSCVSAATALAASPATSTVSLPALLVTALPTAATTSTKLPVSVLAEVTTEDMFVSHLESCQVAVSTTYAYPDGKGTENHSWNECSSTALAVSSDLKATAHYANSYLDLSLAFTPEHTGVELCPEGGDNAFLELVTGTITGSIDLSSSLGGWGNVDVARIATTGLLVIEHGDCYSSRAPAIERGPDDYTAPPCGMGVRGFVSGEFIGWSSKAPYNSAFYGQDVTVGTQTLSQLSYTWASWAPGSTGSNRTTTDTTSDYTITHNASLTSWKITVPPGGPIEGSSTISAPKFNNDQTTFYCWQNGASVAQSAYQLPEPSWSSTGSDPLTAYLIATRNKSTVVTDSGPGDFYYTPASWYPSK